jgi:hypothetical protein
MLRTMFWPSMKELEQWYLPKMKLSNTLSERSRGKRLENRVKKGEANRDSKMTLWDLSTRLSFGSSVYMYFLSSLVRSKSFGVS